MTTKEEASKNEQEYKEGWGIDVTAKPKKATGDEYADEFNSEAIAEAAAKGAVKGSAAAEGASEAAQSAGENTKVITEPK